MPVRQYVEENKFVDLTLVVNLDGRQYWSDTTPAIEAHALDETKLLPQQSRYDANLQHAGPMMKFCSRRNPARELFSGWN